MSHSTAPLPSSNSRHVASSGAAVTALHPAPAPLSRAERTIYALEVEATGSSMYNGGGPPVQGGASGKKASSSGGGKAKKADEWRAHLFKHIGLLGPLYCALRCSNVLFETAAALAAHEEPHWTEEQPASTGRFRDSGKLRSANCASTIWRWEKALEMTEGKKTRGS
ncbi:hypothetical protein JCM10295v2_001225 [Rhodotorula toruloides]